MQKGFRLTLHSEPPLRRKPPKHLRPNKAVSNHLRNIIPDLLSANIIREVFKPFPKLFHSRIFTRPKPDGSYRPIIDLSELNKYLTVTRFKMETVSITKNCLCVPLWGCKADINQAFHNVPIFYDHQVYIAFTIGKGKKLRIFVFQFLPFGLSSAPWAFHRIIKPIKKHLRDLMISVVSYLDDFAFFATTKTGMRQAIQEFKALMKRLNLSINMLKSDFTPKRSIEYLGVQFNLKNLSLSLPESKILSVQSESKSLMTRHACSRRDLESLIGLLNFVAEYIRLGRLRLLPLIRWMNFHTSPRSRDCLVPINDTLRESLEVWTSRPFLSTSIPMHPPLPTMELMTDASTKGWCGVLLPHRTRELWPDYLSKRHINWLELKAVHLSLLHYQHILQGQTLLLWTDSSTALWCLRNQGSRTTDLMILTREILELCDSLDIYLIPRHLQGVLNVLADAGSRPHAIVTEWMLDRTSFERIANLPSIYPQVDLFATRDNRQLENFVSPCPDPDAVGKDAFLLDWNRWESIYLFPPRPVLARCLAKLASFVGTGVLVTDGIHYFAEGASIHMELRRRCRFDLRLPQGVLSQVTQDGVVFAPRSTLHAWIL